MKSAMTTGTANGETYTREVAVNRTLLQFVREDLGFTGAKKGCKEGESQDGKPHPLQKAFVEKGAIQRGFCTPGMIMTAKAILDEFLNPTKTKIRKMMGGNLRRCTGYNRIIDALKRAADELAATDTSSMGNTDGLQPSAK